MCARNIEYCFFFTDLSFGFVDDVVGARFVVQVTQEILGVDNRDDCVEVVLAVEFVVDPELRRDGTWVDESRRFDDNVVERVGSLQNVLQHHLQLSAQRTANAAVAQLENLLKHLARRRVDDETFDPDFCGVCAKRKTSAFRSR